MSLAVPMLTVRLHSGSNASALPKSLYFAVERVDGTVEPGGDAGQCLKGHGHRGTQHAGMGPVVVHRRAQALVGDPVATGERDALDQPAQPQAAQVVGHPAAAVVVDGQPEQRRDGFAQVAVLEAVGQNMEGEQRREQGLCAGVAEAQRRGALAVDDARPVEVVEPFGSDIAVVADALGARQAPVGGKADGLEVPEILQPACQSCGWIGSLTRCGCSGVSPLACRWSRVMSERSIRFSLTALSRPIPNASKVAQAW